MNGRISSNDRIKTCGHTCKRQSLAKDTTDFISLFLLKPISRIQNHCDTHVQTQRKTTGVYTYTTTCKPTTHHNIMYRDTNLEKYTGTFNWRIRIPTGALFKSRNYILPPFHKKDILILFKFTCINHV
jgi:hypothetical protein